MGGSAATLPPSIMGRNINMGPTRFRPSGGSNAEGYTAGRGLSVGEILSQREGRRNAHYADGRAVPDGMRINVPGWASSGVGPGTAGYRGSYRGGGYNYGAGTGRPSARNSDEYFAQRDEAVGNPLDNLELGNSNLMKSFLQNAMAEARGAGGGGAQAAGTDPWADRTTFGDAPQAADNGEADLAQLLKEARAQQAVDASESAAMELAAMTPPTGTGVTTPGATIDGIPSDLWFQYKANESGDTNRFAAPIAPTDDTAGWQFSHRLAPFLKRLGVGQPFAPRRPL